MWWPLVAASCGSRLGLLAPSGPELRALGSNFSTGTGTEEVAQDQHHLPLPVGEHQNTTRPGQNSISGLRENMLRWEGITPLSSEGRSYL